MDEKNWWFATKLQESFQIGGYDCPTLLEDFLSDTRTSNLIDSFFSAGGIRKLFFFCKESSGNRELYVTELPVKDVCGDGYCCMYVFRADNVLPIDVTKLDEQIFCGEMKQSVWSSLELLLSEIYPELFRVQKSWDKYTVRELEHFFGSVATTQKALAAEFCSSSRSGQRGFVILKQPQRALLHELRLNSSNDSKLLLDVESLVGDWLMTIEGVIMEGDEERLLHTQAGPMTEVTRWNRRLNILTSISDQLNSKQSKAIIGYFLASKSKYLKQWKLIDSRIKDATNDARDKATYLNGLRPYFESLYSDVITPLTVVNDVLPGMCQTIKHSDSSSRQYARSGFLRLIVSKICYQLVVICTNFLQRLCSFSTKDNFWQLVENEVEGKTDKSSTQGADYRVKGLMWCLETCLVLHKSLKEAIEDIRDFVSLSQIHLPQRPPGNGSGRPFRAYHLSTVLSSSSSLAGNSITSDKEIMGLQDVDNIMAHFNAFSDRIFYVQVIINILKAFYQLSNLLLDAPDILSKMDELENLLVSGVEEVVEMEETRPLSEPPRSRSTRVRSVDVMMTVEEENEDEQIDELSNSPNESGRISRFVGHDDDNVDSDQDEEDLGIREEDGSSEDDEETGAKSQSPDGGLVSESTSDYSIEELMMNDDTDQTSAEEALCQASTADITSPQPRNSISFAISRALQSTLQLLVSMAPDVNVVLDNIGIHHDKFPAACQAFSRNIEQLQQNLIAYINASFEKMLNTERMLKFLSRFDCVSHHESIGQVLGEKYYKAFQHFRTDLVQIQALYEQHKDDPSFMEHLPKVASAIAWSRHLLKQIEGPIQKFKDVKGITQHVDYATTVKLYNRVASALVTFENLWYNQWLNRVGNARSGLKSLLLGYEASNLRVKVNTEDRVHTLIAEAIKLRSMGLVIPEEATYVLMIEPQLKRNRQLLENLLVRYRSVFTDVPPAVSPLLSLHAKLLLQHIRPGWMTLPWDSVNIDAYLHRAYSAVEKMSEVVASMRDIVQSLGNLIKSIGLTRLYSVEVAVSRVWDLQSFYTAMTEIIKTQSDNVTVSVQRVEENVRKLILLAESSAAELNSTVPHLVSTSSKEPKRLFVKAGSFPPCKSSKRKGALNLSTRQSEPLASVRLPPLPSTVVEKKELPKPSVLPSPGQKSKPIANASSSGAGVISYLDETNTTGLLSHYSSLIYEVIKQCSLQSLTLFLDSMGFKLSSINSCGSCVRISTGLLYKYPSIILDPTLDEVQNVVNGVVQIVLDVSCSLVWWGQPPPNKSPVFYAAVAEDDQIVEVCQSLQTCASGISEQVNSQLTVFKQYDFLWSAEMQRTLHSLENDTSNIKLDEKPKNSESKVQQCIKHVENFLRVEKEIMSLASEVCIGPLCLQVDHLKTISVALAVSWKSKYAMIVHKEGRLKMKTAVRDCKDKRKKLSRKVESLSDLKQALEESQQVLDSDSANTTDYQPIEDLYNELRKFGIFLPRREIAKVANLSMEWQNLVSLAHQVKRMLLVEQRRPFERELDKQHKQFVVTIIRFRNKFDAEGPGMPGIMPRDAIERLREFRNQYKEYVATRTLLNAVQKLFLIRVTPYPELDQLGEELGYLDVLYGLYKRVIDFDSHFRATVWAEADMHQSYIVVASQWNECIQMPQQVQSSDAYNDMKKKIQQYHSVLPVLFRLASKEIRNRHWVLVMEVIGQTFQLEANTFRLHHLLDSKFVEHQKAISKICDNAVAEDKLEQKMKHIEEEWAEQALVFSNYKRRGQVTLSVSETQRLIEQVEDAEGSLTSMLTSLHIGPMRATAKMWSKKLAQVSAVLAKWLAVQQAWCYMESVFCQTSIIQEMPQKLKDFQQIDRNWTKMMRRSCDQKNVLECCLGGDISKHTLLVSLAESLELCQQSISHYLEGKRQACPRLYLMSDSVLLEVMSYEKAAASLMPHLGLVFNDVNSLTVGDRIPGNEVEAKTLKLLIHDKSELRTLSQSLLQPKSRETTDQSSYITTVHSAIGESLALKSPVSISGGLENWLVCLINKIRESVSAGIQKAAREIQAMNVDECVCQNLVQSCQMALRYLWTVECEEAIRGSRRDRKSLMNAHQRFVLLVNRLSGVLIKCVWKTAEHKGLTREQTLKLQSVMVIGLHLRDCLEELVKRKLRDLFDFDWQKCGRFYITQSEDNSVKLMVSLFETTLPYECEYQGHECCFVPTLMTDHAFLALSHVARHKCGVLSGGPGVGKTESVKVLAQLFGKFMLLVNCTPALLPCSLVRLFQGIVQDGGWCCIDDMHNISSESFSVVVQLLQTVHLCLQSKTKSVFLCGKKIIIAEGFSVFATALASSPGMPYSVPSHCRSVFRIVGLAEPDTTVILRGWLTNEGFKSPKMLADRVMVMISLCEDQLPSRPQANFSLASLLAAIRMAGDRRRAVKRSQVTGLEATSPSLSSTGANPGSALGWITRQPSLIPGTISANQLMKFQAVAAVRKANSVTPLTQNAKLDHSLVGVVLKEMFMARMATKDLTVLYNVMRDVWNFSNLHDPDTLAEDEETKLSQIQQACATMSSDLGLIAHSPWLAKVMHLYTLLDRFNGVVVTGCSGSGKSKCLETLAAGLTKYSTDQANIGSANRLITYKTYYINPLSASSLSHVFGYVDSSGKWQEGIFSVFVKRGMKSHNTMNWVCFDGPATSNWTDYLNHILNNNQITSLMDGTRLQLPDNVKIILETTDLEKASPSLLFRAGIVYLDDGALGWKPLFNAWLKTRPERELEVVNNLMVKVISQVAEFVKTNCRPLLTVCEVGVFQTCLALLTTLLNNYKETREIFEVMHVERLFFFAVVWSFGSLLPEADRLRFSVFVKSLTECFPDDDRDVVPLTVFDFYVDESGEFDPWQMRVLDTNYSEAGDMLGEVYVQTPVMARIDLLMDLVTATNKNILLVGPAGVGKTLAINRFLKKTDHESTIVKRLAFCPSTSSHSLHDFLDANMYHRQGFMYGPFDGKSMRLFIDDLNLCGSDEFGNQPANELLRQVLDKQGFYCSKTTGQMKRVDDVSVMACMRTASHVVVPNLSERLTRYFAVFYLPKLSSGSIHHVAFSVLKGCMTQNNGIGLSDEMHGALVKASCDLLKRIQRNLQPCELPGRSHYCFSLKDLIKVFQGLQYCKDENRDVDKCLVSAWQYEVKRVFLDKVCRNVDHTWIEETIQLITAEHFKEVIIEKGQTFVTFPVNVQAFQRKCSAMSHSGCAIKTELMNDEQIIKSLNKYIDRYCEDFGPKSLKITLSELARLHIVRMHRILSFYRGDILMIGREGMELQALAKLALYMSGFEVLYSRKGLSQVNDMSDLLRDGFRQAGFDGKGSAVVLSDTDLEDSFVMEAINAIVVCGELPLLFSNDELQGLLQSLIPTIKRDFPTSVIDPMDYFTARIQRYFRLVVCLKPEHPLLTSQAHLYPGLIRGLNVLWVRDWKESMVTSEANILLAPALASLGSDTKNHLITSIAAIHCQVMRDSKQIIWADTRLTEYHKVPEPSVSVSSDVLKEQRPDSGSSAQSNMSKSTARTVKMMPGEILLERIKFLESQQTKKDQHMPFVGPKMFTRFIECFRRIYTAKKQRSAKMLLQLRLSLSTLDQATVHARNLRKTIEELNRKYLTTSEHASSLLSALTGTASSVEQLSAQEEGSTGFIAAFSFANVQVQELLVDDNDDMEDDLLEASIERYDYQRQTLLDDIQDAEKKQAPLEEKLVASRDKIAYWRGKIDRNTIERLRVLVSPPRVISIVMELVTAIVRRAQEQNLELGMMAAGSRPASSVVLSSTSTRKSVAGLVLPSDMIQSKLDRDQSTVGTVGEAQKVVDTLQQVSWEEGLHPDIATLIETHLSPNSSTEQGTSTTADTHRQTRRDTKIKMSRFSKQAKTTEATPVITLANAKYASEDAATLMQYLNALLEYHHIYLPYKETQMHLVNWNNEIIKLEERQHTERKVDIKKAIIEQEHEAEPVLMKEDLSKLEQSLSDLYAQFEEAVMVKHNIDQQRIAATEKLRHGETALDALSNLRVKWVNQMAEVEGDPGLLTNCLASAAFVTYCLPLEPSARMKLAASFVTIAQKHGLPAPSKKLFHDLSVVSFLEEMDVFSCDKEEYSLEWNLSDEISLQNAYFIMQQGIFHHWQVIVDKQRFVVSWLQRTKKGLKVIEHGSSMLRTVLIECLTGGFPILILDIQPQLLLSDPILTNVLHSLDKFFDRQSLKSFKIAVGSQEVVCASGFMLFMTTTVSVEELSPEFMSSFIVIQFVPTFDGIQGLLCDWYVQTEQRTLHENKLNSSEKVQVAVRKVKSLESLLLSSLAAAAEHGQNVLDDVTETGNLFKIAKEHEKAEHRLQQALESQQKIYTEQNAYKHIACRGAVLFEVARCMASMNSLYQISWENFLTLYNAAISKSDKLTTKNLIAKLTQLVWYSLSRGVQQEDRLFLDFILAMELEQIEGRLSSFDRKFLLSPQSVARDIYLSVAATGTVPNHLPVPNVKVLGKKPFEWMAEEQWHNIQIVGFTYDWFSEAVERIYKEGREISWKHLCEHDMPQSISLPENLNEKLNEGQKLLCLRTIRPDKLLEIIKFFVESVLGNRPSDDMLDDLSNVHKTTTPKMPVFLLYEQEPMVVERLVSDLARFKKASLDSYVLTGVPEEEQEVVALVQTAMANGDWLLLEHVQCCPRLLQTLSNLLRETSSVSQAFQLWISADCSSSFQSGLLLDSVRVMVDTPFNMKTAVLRCLSWIPQTWTRLSSRQEWLPMLHNVSVLHSALRFRTSMEGVGFNVNYVWDVQNFWDALSYVRDEFTLAEKVDPKGGTHGPKGISWTGLKNILTMVVYGSQVTDSVDYYAVRAVIDQWVSRQAAKKDFEAPKTKYKPSVHAYSQPAQMEKIYNAVKCSNLSSTPEMCGMLTTMETQSKEGLQIFSRLPSAFELLAAVSIPQHHQTRRTLMGPPVSGLVSSKGKRPYTPAVLKRRQSFHHGAFGGANKLGGIGNLSMYLNYGAFLKPSKDLVLSELISNLLSRLYKGWNKDGLSERLNMLGENLPLPFWLKEELDQMQKILNKFRAGLVDIRNILNCSDGTSTVLSPTSLSIACDLFHNRIPTVIYHLLTSTLPSQHEGSVTNWIQNLTHRCQHMDHVLSLGQEKVPGFNIGCFFHPEGLLAIFKQDAFQLYEARLSMAEQFVYLVEVTTREKELLRDPATEGFFMIGLYMWHATWDRTSSEVIDVASKVVPQSLPIVHITAVPETEKIAAMDLAKYTSVYSCPCYLSKSNRSKIIMNIDVKQDEVSTLRWPLRGVMCTLRPV